MRIIVRVGRRVAKRVLLLLLCRLLVKTFLLFQAHELLGGLPVALDELQLLGR